MRINSNIPKTFSIYVEKGNKSGYIRFVSVQDPDTEEFYFKMTIVKSQRDASKYVNFDNVKKLAAKYKETYKLSDVKVLDDKLNKFYTVKNAK